MFRENIEPSHLNIMFFQKNASSHFFFFPQTENVTTARRCVHYLPFRSRSTVADSAPCLELAARGRGFPRADKPVAVGVRFQRDGVACAWWLTRASWRAVRRESDGGKTTWPRKGGRGAESINHHPVSDSDGAGGVRDEAMCTGNYTSSKI